MSLPEESGSYCAKRLFTEYDNSLEVTPSDEWEVGCVYENTAIVEDRFRVLMIGIEQPRTIADFSSGPGPLMSPR